jgi:hypothetical protein
MTDRTGTHNHIVTTAGLEATMEQATSHARTVRVHCLADGVFEIGVPTEINAAVVTAISTAEAHGRGVSIQSPTRGVA